MVSFFKIVFLAMFVLESVADFVDSGMVFAAPIPKEGCKSI